MLTLGIPLVLSLIGAYIFLGIKITESIANEHIKVFFWALYLVTLFTLVNISISIYFYSTILHKRGPLGERGSNGEKGYPGTSEGCSPECKPKTVRLMIEKAIEQKMNEHDITPGERKYICNMVNVDANLKVIKGLDLTQYKAVKTKVEAKIKEVTKKNLQDRIKDENANSVVEPSFITKLKEIDANGIDFNIATESVECY